MHMKGTASAGVDLPQAAALFTRSCKGDHGQACHLLGEFFALGKAVKRDEEMAFKLFTQSCALRFEPACELLKKQRAMQPKP